MKATSSHYSTLLRLTSTDQGNRNNKKSPSFDHADAVTAKAAASSSAVAEAMFLTRWLTLAKQRTVLVGFVLARDQATSRAFVGISSLVCFLQVRG